MRIFRDHKFFQNDLTYFFGQRELILDIFKYKINKAYDKTPIRRKFERKINKNKINEIPNLVDFMEVIGVDVDGIDILAPVNVIPSMSAGGANASNRFFSRFDNAADMHSEFLSDAEKRLIAEWLDVGAQYYNNPFDAPAN